MTQALISRRPLLLSGLGAWLASSAQAQSKPIRLVVPFTPGGTADILARAVAPFLGSPGQTVVIDNKPGAGGSIAADLVAKAEPDGQTLLMGHVGTLAVNPSLYPKLPYDPLRHFAPVAHVARIPNVLVVNAHSDIRTLEDLIARAKAKPGEFSYASGGNGSAAHITFESLKLRAGFPAEHIPYRGTAPAVTDLLAGQVQATFTGIPALLPHLKAGKLRALAVSSSRRLAVLPDVPTVAERGFKGFEADQWYGIVAPAGTPAALVSAVNERVNKGLNSAEVERQLSQEGADPEPMSPQAFGQLIAQEIPRWREVVRAGNVRPD